MDLRPYINSLCEPGASRAYGAWCEGHPAGSWVAAGTDLSIGGAIYTDNSRVYVPSLPVGSQWVVYEIIGVESTQTDSTDDPANINPGIVDVFYPHYRFERVA